MTKQEFFKKGNEFFFFDNPEAIADYCKKHWQKDCEHIIRIADEVCQNYFLFDLEHDLERTWKPAIFPLDKEIDWEYQPGKDPEFVYQFNRHRFFICLGQAYWLTKEEKYVRHFVRLLMSWIFNIRRNKETEKTTWRVLEVGIRGEFWVKAMRYFKDSALITDEVIDAYYNCLIEHAEYIIQMHSPYRYISNWGVIENHGLFEIGIAMPKEELRKRYTSIALEHLEVEARMQILGDGVQWEQSPMYHNEVLHCYEDVLILASRNGIQVPDTIQNAVRKMAYVDVAWKKPDHHQFFMGDSDDTDIRDYISIAAYLFKDPILKWAGFPILDFESIWDLGIQSAEIYETIPAQKPDFLSTALQDSGNYYLRSRWEEDGNLLHFHCGTMGGGHGHSDKLHIDLIIHGEDVLTDAGRYTYVVEEGRFDFKNPPAHNTITIDKKFFTICKDSWEYSKLCHPVKQLYKFTDQYEFIQGGHLGYIEDGIFVNRKIIYMKPDIYVIADEIYASGAHSYEQYWNFSERGMIECCEVQKEESEEFTKPSIIFTGNRAQANFFFLTPNLQIEKVTSKISRHYNQYKKREAVKATLEGDGFTSLITVIQGGESNKMLDCKITRLQVKSALKGTYYPSSMAEGLKIERDGKEYVLIICHQEVVSATDLEEADGCIGYGTVIVFDKSIDNKVGTVLD